MIIGQMMVKSLDGSLRMLNSVLRDIALLAWIIFLAFRLGDARTDTAELQQQVYQLQEYTNADGN